MHDDVMTALPVVNTEARLSHDDVIKWKHLPRYWQFVQGIHRWPVNSPHKGQWRGALVFSLTCAWIYGWVNNRESGDLRRHRAHYDITVNLHILYSGYCWLGKTRSQGIGCHCNDLVLSEYLGLTKPNAPAYCHSEPDQRPSSSFWPIHWCMVA